MQKLLLSLALLLLILGCNTAGNKAESQTSAEKKAGDPALQAEVDSFLKAYTDEFVKLYDEVAEASWVSNTHIVEGDDSIEKAQQAAEEKMSAFTGAVATIEKARAFMEKKADLTNLQVKQLEAVLYAAAGNPQTVPELVKERIAAETKQNKDLFNFKFQIDGKEVSTNEIDRILVGSDKLDERLKAWNTSKDVGKGLKEGLANLVRLRNGTVNALGYSDYFSYQVSEYGMTTEEMMALNRKFIEELRPLYRELHTWARYELAEKFGAKDVPELIPAHWLPNRWAQSWGAMVEVEGLDLDAGLAENTPEELIRTAEAFYVSLGFPELPQSFWEKSSLYPLPEDSPFKKNNHASAWHMDLQHDVRSLMSVEPNARWYETTHHELGHIYYYLSYTRPEVPPLLRGGANRAFHEGVGSLIGMASMQKPYLAHLGLASADAKVDEMKALLREALEMVVFIPFSAGTMTHFEHDIYAGTVDKDHYNAKWWEYVKTFQGVEPPAARGEAYCDAASKTHINNDAAQYYDYALSYIILHQLHAHIAKNILHQDPHATNYFGSKETGTFLANILKEGSTRDWRELMRENLGEEISAKPMLEYFAPLMDYLQEQNKGRTYTLAEI